MSAATTEDTNHFLPLFFKPAPPMAPPLALSFKALRAFSSCAQSEQAKQYRAQGDNILLFIKHVMLLGGLRPIKNHPPTWWVCQLYKCCCCAAGIGTGGMPAHTRCG